ncbi:hypothetical protein [Mycobacterium sp. 141]|uniref:hypothetical protein n=1 Tax=Mycobacterium sp. 141 TaxID=1120797 RepID=UPI00036B8123|nr:hypothetical protein [Mycobacterium sp. 141]
MTEPATPTADQSPWGWAHLVSTPRTDLIEMVEQRAAADPWIRLSPNDDRNIVNMLRHDFTTYDEQVRSARSDRLYREVLDAIAADFPWLAGQCRRDRATHGDRLPLHVTAQRGAWTDARTRMAADRAVASGLSVGDRVTVSWHGPRRATVTEVRRSRVRVRLDEPTYGKTEIDVTAGKVTR